MWIFDVIYELKENEFYIKIEEDVIILINNDIIKIEQCNYIGYYKITLNFFLLERMHKICKILKNHNEYQLYVEFIKLLISKKVSNSNILNTIYKEDVKKS